MPKKDVNTLNWQHQYPRGPELDEGMWRELRSMYSDSVKAARKKDEEMSTEVTMTSAKEARTSKPVNSRQKRRG